MRISIFGLGYIGSVTGAAFASDGHDVIGVDANPDKVALVNAGKSPVVEPGLDELLGKTVAEGKFRGTMDVKEAVANSTVSLICVGTPSQRNGNLGLDYLERVTQQIGEAIADVDHYHVVIVRSTVLPGTTHKVVIPTLEKASGKKYGEGFGVAVNPEFLREGTALKDFRKPPLTLVGHNHAMDATQTVGLYSGVEAPLVDTTIRVAEMVKYTSNTWHALKVCFANEIGNLCKRMDIDSHQLMDIFCTDTKLNISPYYMKPGFAFGGSCLPKDVRAMQYRAKELDLDMPVLNAILPSNRLQVEHAFDEVIETGKKHVGLLGFSFKEGTDDLRESPIVTLAEMLIGKGLCLKIYDKNVSIARLMGANKKYIEEQITHLSSLMVGSIDELIEKSEVIVIGNQGAEFVDALKKVRDDQIVIDLVRLPVTKEDLPAGYRGLAW